MGTIEKVMAWLDRNEWACLLGIGAGLVLVGFMEQSL